MTPARDGTAIPVADTPSPWKDEVSKIGTETVQNADATPVEVIDSEGGVAIGYAMKDFADDTGLAWSVFR